MSAVSLRPRRSPTSVKYRAQVLRARPRDSVARSSLREGILSFFDRLVASLSASAFFFSSSLRIGNSRSNGIERELPAASCFLCHRFLLPSVTRLLEWGNQSGGERTKDTREHWYRFLPWIVGERDRTNYKRRKIWKGTSAVSSESSSSEGSRGESEKEDATGTSYPWFSSTILLLRKGTRERNSRGSRERSWQTRQTESWNTRRGSRGTERGQDGGIRTESPWYHDGRRESRIASLVVPRGQRSVDQVSVSHQRNDRYEKWKVRIGYHRLYPRVYFKESS